MHFLAAVHDLSLPSRTRQFEVMLIPARPKPSPRTVVGL